LDVLEDAIQKLCRNAYYGTAKAQKLAEGAVPLLVWLLNRKYFKEQFHVHLLKCLSEMCWTSLGLKNKVSTRRSRYSSQPTVKMTPINRMHLFLPRQFNACHGTKVLYHHMSLVTGKKRLACWCAYAMAMMSCGSAEMIIGVREIEINSRI